MCALLVKKGFYQTSGCTVRVRRGLMLHHNGAKSLEGQFLPGLVPPSSQAEATRHSHSYMCPRSAEKEFLNLIQSGHFPHCTGTSSHLPACWAWAVQGLHNFWPCWPTHIPKELRGHIGSGLSITKYYFPMHLWNHPSSKFQPGEVTEMFEGFRGNFGQQKKWEEISWI